MKSSFYPLISENLNKTPVLINLQIKANFTYDWLFYNCHRRVRMSTDILDDVSNAINLWMQRITDVESRINQTNNTREAIIILLEGQVIDGLISELESQELQFILNSWINLYTSLLHHFAGVSGVDRDIFTYLLRLLTANQISEQFFTEIALQVCRGEVNLL